ncbi:amino acid adenylation domain-containing protein [Streptomyces ziwulingensis]|uniref:Carrier domain-containing protein n=1 Tax=Streptomyces ziwulingensis TaxID=1045501 RepID=A0ABP9CEJ0_9ACTN
MNGTTERIPLSVGQEAMWVTWRREPEQWTHIMPFPFLVHGVIDVARLAAAVAAVGHAHPQIRGRVTTGARGPELDWSDAPGIPVRESTTSLRRDEAVRRAWQVPFDLRRGPLARVDVLRGPDYTVVLLAMHHLVSDGASTLILVDALRRAYAGEPLPPADSPSALTEYAHRSRALTDTPAGDAARAYWRRALGDRAPRRLLRQTVDEPAYLMLGERLPAGLTARLRARAAELGVSYVTVLLAAYHATLHHHSGADDLLVFLPFHGRTDGALRDRVGYFVNALPIRIRTDDRDTHADLLSRVRRGVKDALRHGDLPLPAIMRAAGLTGPEAYADTHQTVFQYWHAGLRDGVDLRHVPLDAPGASAVLSVLDVESGAGFRLALAVREDSAGTHLLWKDPAGAVGSTQVAALASGYRRVLETIASDPYAPLAASADAETERNPAPAGPAPRPAARTAPVPAAGTVPDAMRRVWEETLGIEGIDDGDSFFELGGHSLLAEQLTVAVSRRFGREVALRTLFEQPRLSDFAAAVLPARPRPAPPALPAAFPASAFQQRVWLSEQLDTGQGAYNVPMAWRIAEGGLDRAVLTRALARTVARHEILRTAFEDRDGEPWQVVGPPWAPEVESVDLSRLPDPEQRLSDWLHEAARHRLDPASGRLLTAALIETGHGGQVLFLCPHHLLWDGESTDIFLRELAADYAHAQAAAPAAREGERPGVSLHLRLGRLPEASALEKAVGAVVEAHEALRRTAAPESGPAPHEADGTPAVHPVWFPPRTPADTSDASEVPDRLRTWAREPCDPPNGPLLRLAVLPGPGPGGWLTLAGHPSAVDRRSLKLVAHQIFRLLDGGGPPRPSSRADWYDTPSCPDPGAALEARAAVLRPAAEELTLPGRRPRDTHPARAPYAPERVGFTAAPEQVVRSAAEKLGLGSQDLLLAAFAALLGWYTGRQDLLVGVRTDGRAPSGRQVVGPLEEVLPVRLRPEAGVDFAGLAARTAADLAEAVACPRVPLREMMRRVDPAGTAERDPAVTVLFDYDDDAMETGGGAAPAPGTDLDPPAGAGPYDLALVVRRRAGQFESALVFDARCFDEDRIRTMAGHYVRLLALLLDAPGRPVGEAEPLTEAERHTQIAAWNATEAGYPQVPVHDVIRRHALARPQAIAVRAGRTELTYRELLEGAQATARGLLEAGVRPGERVALLLPRGVEQVRTILAVLLAGAAYLPIDPHTPRDRLRFLLADSAARFVVVPDEQTEPHPALTGYTGRSLRGAALSAAGGDRALPAVPLDSPAYCIYTSGTTGRPKGVVISHRNLIRLLHNDRFPFSFGPSDVWSVFHAYTFDVSVWELLGGLSHGGRVVLVTEQQAQDPTLLLDLLRREGVTVLCQTPSAFRGLLRAEPGAAAVPDALRCVILAGEALHPAMLKTWAHARPGIRLVNMYGPTETTVYTSIHTVTRAEIDADLSVIGRPLPTTTLYLLDRHSGRRLLPVGAVGEIHIGGAGVAAGYLNRADLTAERFVDSPFGSGTLFRSGDLAHHLPDGSLRFLGRADDQLKVRGFRIEPAEVEAGLRRHPAVTDAAVYAEDERLVAVVQSASAPAPEALRAHLATLLPEYMIPSLFKTVTAMPLTTQGKRDVRALRTTAAGAATPGPAAPPTPTAAALTELCGTLLGVGQVAADDSFFLLGGHSMLAVRLVGRIRESFGVTLPVRAVFEQPRLRDLADLIDRESSVPAEDAVRAPRPRHSPNDPPAGAFQRSVWLADQVAGGTRYNVPLAWKLTGSLDAERLARALAHLVDRHELLRTAFVMETGTLRQVVREPWQPPVERLDLSAAPDPDEELTRWLTEAAGRPFDPATGRLLRTALADLGAGRQALLVCLHHLVVDAGSVPVLLSELERCYQAAGGGHRPPPPARQYRHFTAAQEATRQSPRYHDDLAHWQKKLVDAPVRTDFPAPARPEPDGVVRLALPADLPDRLRPLLTAHHATPFIVFCAALALALHRRTGRRSLTLGTPVSTRDPVRFRDLLGPCLDTVVLRSEAGAPAGTRDDLAGAIRQMHAELLTAREHLAAPFDDVIGGLEPDRDPGRTPYVDVMLNMISWPGRPPVLGGLPLEAHRPEALQARSPKFPLVLTVAERAGELTAHLAHQGDRVGHADAQALADELVRLLTTWADAPPSSPAPAGPPVRQYRDLLAAQRAALDTEAHRADLAHWRARLDGAPVHLGFPLPARPGPDGVVDLPLPSRPIPALRPLLARHGVSPYMIAVTCLAAVLHRWSAEPDVVVSSEMSTRATPDCAGVLGPCQNTVVLRSRIEDTTTLLDALHAVRAEVLAAFEHARTPFDEVVRAVNPPRTPGRVPYGDISLEFRTAAAAPPALGGHVLRPMDLARTGAGFLGKSGATVSLVLDGDRLTGRIGYRGDRYRRQDMEDIAVAFGRTLESFADRLAEPVAGRGPRAATPPAGPDPRPGAADERGRG